MRHLSFSAFAHTRRGHTLMAAGAMLAIGVIAGAAVQPVPSLRHRGAPAFAVRGVTAPFVPVGTQRLDPQLVYAADVVRVIDGDTFAARVRVWPGLNVDTHVRLRDIDAAELHARCASELRQAIAARAALQAILAEGGVTIWHVGLDKYAGRVDATVATRGTADVSAAMLRGGFARRYDGGRRGSWCR